MSGILEAVQGPTRQPIQDRQQGFTGGLNNVSDPATLDPTQARQLVNCALTVYGAATKRGGTQEMSASRPNGSNAIAGGAWWPTQLKFVIVAGFNLYTGGATIPVTWTSIGSAVGNMLSAGAMRPFLGSSSIDTMYIADGDAVGLKSLNSAGAFTDGISGTPPVNGIEVYNQRLWGWFFGSSTGNNSLYYSNLSTATNSIGGDSLGVAASGGGVILVQTFGESGIITSRVIGASLLIFHIRGVSRLTGFGQSDITVTPQSVSADFSIVGAQAVVVYNGVGWAVSMLGLYVITEGGTTPVGTPARPDPLPQALMQATSNTTQSTGVSYNVLTNEVWVVVNGVGLYVYHTILQSWSGPWTGPYVNQSSIAFIAFPGDPLNNHLPYTVFCDANGWPLKCDITSCQDYVTSSGSAGTGYAEVLQCHRQFGGSAYIAGTEATLPVGASMAKSWRMANVLATLSSSASAPTLTAATQYGGAVLVTLPAPTSQQQTYYTAIGGAGPYIDITITGTDLTGYPAEYASVDVEGFATGRR